MYEKTLDQLINIADKIENGTATREIQKVYSRLSSKDLATNKKIYNTDGELLFSISPTGSITINKLIFRRIDHQRLEQQLSELTNKLSEQPVVEIE